MLEGMSFQDLPADWAQRPITDPDVFEGVIDLIVTDQARCEGSTYVLLCHEGGRLMQPICLPDEPHTVDVVRVQDGLTRLFTEAAGEGVHDVVMAIARPGRPDPTPRDHDLRVAFEEACSASGVRLLGVAIAAPTGVTAFPADGSVAA
ncbi:hypothetical protein FHX52_1457 [Humibacillus xanthopallidus]|uniref:Uncharacterized protein n=2 Tax=Humibacillus xanthopallidus TaxID=412689 RepID=A0A543PW81_9MICO|nr:hypothetical protein FHX52_1457 [Humibacillus xanthopallidus]